MSTETLQRLLPDLYDETVEALWPVGAERIDALKEGADKIADLQDPERIDLGLLDAMAQTRQAFFTDLADTEERKRSFVAESLCLHSKKGTPWAVKQAFSALGLQARVIPWWKYGGEPYHYKVDIATKDREISASLAKSAMAMCEEMGSLRDISDGVDLGYLCDGIVYAGCGVVGESYAECDHIDGYVVTAPASAYAVAGAIGEVYTNIGGDT